MPSKETLVLAFSATISGSVGAAFDRLTSSIQKIDEKLKILNRTSEKIAAFRKVERDFIGLQRRMQSAGAVSKQLNERFREQVQRLQELRREFARAGIAVKRLSAQFRVYL